MALSSFDDTTLQKALLQFREEFKGKLSDEMSRDFRFTEHKDLEQAVQDIQKQHVSEKKLQDMRRLGCFLEVVDSYSKVIDLFANVHQFVPFIWGPIKFLLQVAKNHAQAFGALLDTYQEIGQTLPLLYRYEDVFRQCPDVKIALVCVYQEILEFHFEGIKFFQRPMWAKLFTAVWKTFRTGIEPIIRRLKENRRLLESTANLAHFRAFYQDRKQQIVKLDQILQSETERRKKEIYQWLGYDDSAKLYQRELCGVRKESPKCGLWLLEKEAFQKWANPQLCLSPLLWMHGQPGAGKTVLASLIIETCQNKDCSVIYFYCKQADANRDNFAALACAMVWQVFRENTDIVDYLFENCSNGGHSNLRTDEISCEELAQVALQTLDKVYVVIDGLDECKEQEQEKIIKFFCSLIDEMPQERAESLRCLLISQNDSISKKLLWQRPILALTEDDIIEDIAGFALRESKRIDCLNEDRANQLARDVKNYSRGMFLYAKLVMENLNSCWSSEEVENELKDATFPRGIEQAYQRILERIVRGPHPNHRKRILDILGMLATATRPLKWREVQGALAIDIERRDVNFLGRRINKTPKEIFSSLVEERANGNVELVHATARTYLFTLPEISEAEQNLHFSRLCVSLLAAPCFCGATLVSNEDIETNVRNGCYAFLDYAVAHWWCHTNGVVMTLEDSTNLTKLSRVLDLFLDYHYQTPTGTRRVNGKLGTALEKTMGWWAKREDLNHAITATRHQVRPNGSNSDHNEALDVPQVLQRVRAVLERTTRESESVIPGVPDLRTIYGSNLFKCSRMGCFYFFEGFETHERRQVHIDKHEKPFQCTFPACPHADIGFGTKTQLNAHLKTQHGQRVWDDDEFPPRIKFLVVEDDEEHEPDVPEKVYPSKFDCPICGKAFTRNLNLEGHVRSHKGEKPHKCSMCGKRFARKNDQTRHEDLHSGKKKHICTGKLGDQLYDGEVWGCGKDFWRAHKLAQHYIFEEEGSGRPACIEPLVTQVFNPDGDSVKGKYECKGVLTSEGAEPIEWGCKKPFKTAKAIKKHWKHHKGRYCLRYILKGREQAPPPKPEPVDTEYNTAPTAEQSSTMHPTDPDRFQPPHTEDSHVNDMLPSFNQGFGHMYPFSGTDALNGEQNIGFNFSGMESADVLDGFDFDAFLQVEGNSDFSFDPSFSTGL